MKKIEIGKNVYLTIKYTGLQKILDRVYNKFDFYPRL